jgi:hypothetical protein
VSGQGRSAGEGGGEGKWATSAGDGDGGRLVEAKPLCSVFWRRCTCLYIHYSSQGDCSSVATSWVCCPKVHVLEASGNVRGGGILKKRGLVTGPLC